LRAQHFNYISLKIVLSEAGLISKIPIASITLVSAGRSACLRIAMIWLLVKRDVFMQNFSLFSLRKFLLLSTVHSTGQDNSITLERGQGNLGLKLR